jgi:hypothetical protein
MNPFLIAAKGKGIVGTIKRGSAIQKRYGLTASQMDRQLARFADILHRFDGGATFPTTVVALTRAPGFAHKYQDRNIEFAVHGYFHWDHTRLPLEQQSKYLEKALEIFKQQGLVGSGFRCPYLRWNEETLTAIKRAGFLYDGSQGLAWDVADAVNTAAYDHVLDFYGAISASDYPALPSLEDGLVRIPYCLPDDEALVERFRLSQAETMTQIWEAILMESHRLGELFTLGLHPERIAHCETALVRILQRARQLAPPVWFARLDEIARWWKARAESQVTVQEESDRTYQVCVDGPEGVTILARNIDVLTPTATWDDTIKRGLGTTLRFQADRRPFIGISPSSAPHLLSFLRQQGYIVELTEDCQKQTYYLDRPTFKPEDQRRLLQEIDQADFPLIRLGRWPNGARSALSITGDIDALTIWDYGLRIFGK